MLHEADVIIARLTRERDEARAQATAWREKFAKLETERASCCVEMERERDEAQAERDRLFNAVSRLEEISISVLNQRDEARQERDIAATAFAQAQVERDEACAGESERAQERDEALAGLDRLSTGLGLTGYGDDVVAVALARIDRLRALLRDLKDNMTTVDWYSLTFEQPALVAKIEGVLEGRDA